MSQQVLDVYAPLVKVSAGESLPVAAIGGQTRDGKDEIILGTVPFVRNASNTLWVPVDQGNPLEARVRELEKLIGSLNASKETNPDAASAALLALLRGLLAVVAKESTLGSLSSSVAKDSTLSSLASAVAKDATLGNILTVLDNLATEATLGDVAAALSILAGTVSDGAAKVALTGRIVEVIIEHIGRTDMIGATGVRYFADGVGGGTGAPPVDVRPYARRLIHIRNGHDESMVARVFGYFSFHTSGAGNHRVGPIAEADIPAGAAMTFSPEEYVGLTTPYPGLSVQLTPVSTSATGDVDVIYTGARI